MVKKTPKAGGADPLEPEKVAETAAEKQASDLADYSWAVNAVKLNRAKAKVQQNPETKALKGKAQEDAVKASYVSMNGLLKGDEPVRAGKGGRVKNMADDDGSKD